MSRQKNAVQESPDLRLQRFVNEATDLAKKARRHRASLNGINFYADKLARLRSDATNTFGEFPQRSVGDLATTAELLQRVFSPDTDSRERAQFARDLLHELKTKRWEPTSKVLVAGEEDAIFPLSLLSKTRKGYLVAIGRQMNGCFAAGWYDACAVMMRRLIETSIVEAFEGKNIADHIKNTQGDFLQLSDLIQKSIAEQVWNLSRNAKKALPNLRDIGHISAHSRRFTAQKSDLERLRQDCRLVVEELLHLAGLL